ncbi:hypothetical protein LTR53_011842 [Teratosphaeriaceae sp. CCFEE 6253]|nr:hypothetical protein LTR53_011842 [Teratosphaeriaceae sp. CCFEE 6253]
MASRTSRSQIIEIEYKDPRTGERVFERKVQEVPWDDVADVRNRELALVTRGEALPELDPRRYQEPTPLRNGEAEYARCRVQRDRYEDEDRAPRRRDDYDHHRAPLQREAAAYDDDSDSESSRERRRRRRRREERRARDGAYSDAGSSRRGAAREREQQPDDGGRLWYSMKARSEGNLLERNFDSSYDGLIAAAAGAALGAITARSIDKHQGDGQDSRQKKVLKLVGGAAAGAAVMNAGENWYRIYTEEKEERAEENKDDRRKEKRRERENGFMSTQDALGGVGAAIA